MAIQAQLSSRLITGIGEPTPVEVGMVFDRNVGIPYIPASSIKGAVSYAYCVNYVAKAGANDPYVIENGGKVEFKTEEPGFMSLFGARDLSEAARGGFSFMDAYPVSRPDIVQDIMNPHFGNYYKGGKPPSETDNPIPIKFLAVEKGVIFNFYGYYISKVAEKYNLDLLDAFETAIVRLGLGAKTATGYGTFNEFSDKSSELFSKIQNQEKAERAKAEARKKQELEARLKEEQRQKEEQKRILKEEAEKAHQEAVESSVGIEKDILLLEKGTIQMAFNFYEQYFKEKNALSDPAEIKLAGLVEKQFKTIPKVTGKKAKKDQKGTQKYAKRLHMEKLLEATKNELGIMDEQFEMDEWERQQ